MTSQEFMGVLKKNPISVGCAMLSAALAVGIYLRSDATPEAEADLTQKSASAERLALNIKYSAQLKEQAEAVAAASKAIEAQLVRANQIGTNTQYFYKLEEDTGVKIIELRQTTSAVQGKPAKGNFVPVAFGVTVQGDVSQILQFLRYMEVGAHYSRVLSASCSSNAAFRQGPLTLGLSVELLGLP